MKRKNDSGQSLIEFLMTIVFVIGIFFIFVKIAFNAVDGYLIHYATFMASRTYMVADINGAEISQSVSTATTLAKKAFERLHIDTIGYDTSALQFNQYNSNKPLFFVGCYFDFEQKFSAMSFIGGSEPMHLRSESFLGKEPPKQECLDRICDRMGEAYGGGDCGKFALYFDNGC